MLKYVWERLKKVLKDPFVKDNFLSMVYVGFGLLIVGVLVRAVVQLVGLEHASIDVSLFLIASCGLVTILIGSFGIITAFFAYKEPKQE